MEKTSFVPVVEVSREMLDSMIGMRILAGYEVSRTSSEGDFWEDVDDPSEDSAKAIALYSHRATFVAVFDAGYILILT